MDETNSNLVKRGMYQTRRERNMADLFAIRGAHRTTTEECPIQLLKLLLERCEAMGDEMLAIRSSVRSIETSSASASLKLERIEDHLRAAANQPAPAPAPDAHPSTSNSGSHHLHAILIAASVLCWMLTSQRRRKFLRQLPIGALLTGQLLSLGGLAVMRGLNRWDDAVNTLRAGSDAAAYAKGDQRECRCALASLALFVCTTLLPAKALAHVAALVLHERTSRASKLSSGRRLA